MNKHTQGNWTVGKTGGAVVTDIIPSDFKTGTGHDDVDYYGGFLICESVAKIADAKLIAAAPEMLDLLQSIENDSNQIPKWFWNKIQKVVKKATE